MQLVEPFKSAQYYIIWDARNPHLKKGDRVWYKWIKQGWFSKTLFVWKPEHGRWDASSHPKIPTWLAKQKACIKITDKNRTNLQMELERDPEDIAWELEQQEFIRQKAAARARMGQKDRERSEMLKNNKVDVILDRIIARNKDL